MKKKIIIIVSILILTICIGIGIVISTNQNNSKIEEQLLNGTNSKIEVPLETNEIILETGSGVAEVWECEIYNKSIASASEFSTTSEDQKDLAGGLIEIHYVIHGKKEGTTIMQCNYVDRLSGSAHKSPEKEIITSSKTFKINVDKNLNVKITELKDSNE